MSNYFISIFQQLCLNSLGFQITLPLLSLCYTLAYALKMYQNPLESTSLHPQRTTSIFATLLQFAGVFITLGLLIMKPEFYIIFVLYLLQFLLYIILSVSFLGTKTPRFCCKKVIKNNITLKVLVSILHLLLGFLNCFAVVCSGFLAKNDVYDLYVTNKHFNNCSDVLVGGTFFVLVIHLIGFGQELIWLCIGVKLKKKGSQIERKYCLIVDENGKEVQVSYDQSSEIL